MSSSTDKIFQQDLDAVRNRYEIYRAKQDDMDKAVKSMGESASATQVGGSHYKDMVIQPVEFIYRNDIPYMEACAIKYLCRWRSKGGIQDLQKAKHYIDLLIEMEGKK